MSNEKKAMTRLFKFLKKIKKELRTPIIGDKYNTYRIMVILQNPAGRYEKRELSKFKTYKDYKKYWLKTAVKNQRSRTDTIKRIINLIKDIFPKVNSPFDYILYSNLVKKPQEEMEYRELNNIFNKQRIALNEKKIPIIEWEIEKFKPKVILLFGEKTNKLFQNYFLKKCISKIRTINGNWFFEYNNIPIISFYHPTSRGDFTSKKKNKLKQKIKKIKNILNNKKYKFV